MQHRREPIPRPGHAAAAACALAALALVPHGAAATAALELAPCRLEHPSRLAAIAAECGRLRVPEDPGRAGGGMLELAVARVPAISARKADDPLFVLAGGPGLAASTFYASVAGAFARIRRERDIVLVDQRGTGGSNALACELDRGVVERAATDVLEAETGRCLRALQTRADVALYTTSLAVRDLDAVRAALGYRRLALYGSSYGTRVAQHYLRRYPQRVRALILDGVVPPEVALGPGVATAAQRALESILGRCAAEPACHAAFGDPAASLRKLRAQLAARRVSVTLPDPTSGELRTIAFGPDHLATVLRLQSYSAEQAALLPLSLHQGAERANLVPLAGQFLLATGALEQLAYGMHNTVACSEDVAFFAPFGERASLRETYIGAAQVEALETMCRLWPRGPVDGDFKAPLSSRVPALLLSGGDDPVTPPAYGAQAQRGLPNSRHVVIAGLGHGLLGAPCMDRVMARFLADPDPQALDLSCLRAARPLPFFTSLAGPPP